MPYKDPEKRRENARIYNSKPEVKEKAKEWHKKYYSKPEVKVKMKEQQKEYLAKPKTKSDRREYFKRPDIRKKHNEITRLYRLKPENKEKEKKYRTEYSSRPEVKAKKKEYSSKPEVKAKKKEYSSKPEVKAKKKEYGKEYNSKSENRIRRIIINNKIRIDVKTEVFSYYSKKISNSDIPICACCLYDDLRALTLDHIKGRMNVSPEEKQLHGVPLYKFVKAKGLPDEYQILCFNCNTMKGIKPQCPHQLDKMKK